MARRIAALGPGLGRVNIFNSKDIRSHTCHLQDCKSFLGFFSARYRWHCLCALSQYTQPEVCQGAAEGPSFWQVLLHCYVTVSFCSTGNTNASYYLLYCTFVDEIIEPQSIRILKFEFIVIGKKAEEKKWLKCSSVGIQVMNILTTSNPQYGRAGN